MLRARGVPPIASAEQASGRQVLIRSHGVAPQVLEALHRCGAQVLDLTCPFVDKLHRIVEAESGPECPVILLGEKEHPEVQGTAGWARGPVYVLSQEGLHTDQAFATAVILLVMVLLINILSSVIAKKMQRD